nr:hypothetical protein [Tanacetum cinerariifolium]
EIKWKGSRAREGNGYKLWYSGSSIARNGVGIILTRRLKDNVFRVTRSSDRIMAIYVVIEGETVNVISAHAPQVGLSDADKKRFWDALDEILRECPTNQRLIIRGRFKRPYRCCSGWLRGVANSFFKKSDAHLITFQSGGHNTQIDYLLVLRGDLKACKDCGVFPGVASARIHSTHMESWWFCEGVQTKVATKQSRFKELLSCSEGNQEDIDRAKERYKAAKKKAKIAVVKAKDKACEDLYKKLDSKEGVNDIYKIAKAQERRRMNIGNVKYIKDEGGRTIVREEDIVFLISFQRDSFRRDAKMPDEWRLSEVIPVYKNKSDAQACSNYRGVLCDKRIPLKLKGKFYRVAIRPAMMYGSECWPITKALAFKVEVAELRMLRWTCGKTMIDIISNGVFRAALDVDSIIDKMREERLRWFGHVKRRLQSAPVRRVEAMVVEGSRRKGRPKLRWEDRLKMDMKELCLSKDMTYGRNSWRDRIRISSLVAFLADRSPLFPLVASP